MPSDKLSSTLLFRHLIKCSGNDPTLLSLGGLVERAFTECADVMKSAVRFMPEYTLHDEVHLVRVVELMGRLIPNETLRRLSPLDIAALILSAGFHDVGMSPSATEIQNLLGPTEEVTDSNLRLRYQGFRHSYPALIERQQHLRVENRHFEAQEIEAFLLAEFLRETHAERGRIHIFSRTDLRYDEYDFAPRLAEVCASHNAHANTLENLPCWELVRAPGEYTNWRFVAVLLRLADILDFDPKRTPRILFDHLGIRSSISVREWKKHQAVKAWDIRPGRIAFSAKCADPVIEKCMRDFIEMIDSELISARALLLGLHDSAAHSLPERYHLELPTTVDQRGIGPILGSDGPAYEYVDLSFQLDRDNVVSLIMGIALYAEPVLFLRELLQNAVDACRHRRALHQSQPQLGRYRAEISVRLLKKGDHEFFVVEDNGMGMDEEVIRRFFARIGRSYYKSGRFLEEKTRNQLTFEPVSQFGIGILSVFMAGDTLDVETRRFSSDAKPYSIEIAGEGSLFWFRKGRREVPGTNATVRLKLPSKELLRSEQDGSGITAKAFPSLVHTIAELAPHIEFPIAVEQRGKSKRFRGEWQLPDDPLDRLSLFRQIDIDLTTEAPDGIDGIARMFLLEEGGVLQQKIYLGDADSEQEDGENLSDYLQHSGSHITHVHVDRGVKGGLSQGYSVEIDCNGRWSQLGFAVPTPLFSTSRLHAYEAYARPNLTAINFPVPVHYDVNLSGDFVMPLSADRKSVLPTQRARAVCERLCATFSALLFRQLGSEVILQNVEFLRKVAKEVHQPNAVFLTELDNAIRHLP